MLRRTAGGRATGHTDYNRNGNVAAEHIAHLGRLIDQLIHHAEQEIAILQVGHRAA